MVIGVGVFIETLRGDDADALILVGQGQVENGFGIFAGDRRLQLLDIGAEILGIVVDDHLFLVLEAPDRQAVLIRERESIGSQKLVLLGRAGEIEGLLVCIVEADAKDGGIHQLIDVFIDGVDDIPDREGRGDLAADQAELFDVIFLRLYLGRTLLDDLFQRPAALLQLPGANANQPSDQAAGAEQVEQPCPPTSVPGGGDGEGIEIFLALLLKDVARLNAKAVFAGGEIGIVAPGFTAPGRPAGVKALEPGAESVGARIKIGRSGKIKAQGIVAKWKTLCRRILQTMAGQGSAVIDNRIAGQGDAANDRREIGQSPLLQAVRKTDDAVRRAEPDDAIALRKDNIDHFIDESRQLRLFQFVLAIRQFFIYSRFLAQIGPEVALGIRHNDAFIGIYAQAQILKKRIG